MKSNDNIVEVIKIGSLFSIIPAAVAGFWICDRGGYIWKDGWFVYINDSNCFFSFEIFIIVFLVMIIFFIPLYLHYKIQKSKNKK